MILYPCAECGNIDGDRELHGGGLEEKRACGGLGDDAPTGCARQATNLAELHHRLTDYMDFRVLRNRPAATSLVGEMRGLSMRTTGHAHEHGWSGIMKRVFAQMRLEYLIRFVTGGAKKLVLYRNVYVKTRFPSRLADSIALEGTIWSKKRPSSSTLQVEDSFVEFWNSIYSSNQNQNQHLFLKLITGSSYASVERTTINRAFRTYTNYTDTADDVQQLKEYTNKICQDEEKESAYL